MKKILLVLTFILTLSSQLMAYEETNYEVVKENKIYEIRKYPNRLVIETNSVQGNGFRKLFNYISGNNKENEEIKMTVPVTQEIKNENMTMQFYLPSKFNKDNAPKPVDSEVKILTIEGGYYAVIEYSGRSSDKNFLKNKDILEKQTLLIHIVKLMESVVIIHHQLMSFAIDIIVMKPPKKLQNI